MLITRLVCIQWKSSRFLSTVSKVSASNAWDPEPLFGVGTEKIRKKNACIFWVSPLKQARLIMHVLFSAAVIVLVPVHWFLEGKSCISRKTMFYLPCTHPTPAQSTYFPFLIYFYFYFPFTTSTPHRSHVHIDPASTFCFNTVYLY